MMRKVCQCASLMLLAFIIAACSGRASSTAIPRPADSGSVDITPPDPSMALGSSAERLTQVQSGRSTFSWLIERDGFRAQGNGTYSAQSPGNLQVEEHYRGQGNTPTKFNEANDSNLLVLGEKIFLNTPALGSDWVQFTPTELGADWNVIQRLLLAKSPLDYKALTASVSGDIASIGTEPIGGHYFMHLRAVADAGSIMDALAHAYGSQGQIMLAHRFSGNVPLDLWLDSTTLLPKRIKVNGQFTFMGAPTQLQLTVEFSDFDSVDRFTDAPKNAKPVSQLGR